MNLLNGLVDYGGPPRIQTVFLISFSKGFLLSSFSKSQHTIEVQEGMSSTSVWELILFSLFHAHVKFILLLCKLASKMFLKIRDQAWVTVKFPSIISFV